MIGLDALHGAPAHAGRKDGDRPDPSRRVYEEAIHGHYRRSEHRIPQGQGSLSVRDYAGRGPTFVLLNGFPDNSDIYDAANQARLEDFRRLQARIPMIWGKADAYLNVGVVENPAIVGEECLASPDPSRALGQIDGPPRSPGSSLRADDPRISRMALPVGSRTRKNKDTWR